MTNYFYSPINIKDDWNIFKKGYVGREVQFWATKAMKIDDLLLLYVGKNNQGYAQGVYAVARVLTEPELSNGNGSRRVVKAKIEFIDFEKPFMSKAFVIEYMGRSFQKEHIIKHESYKIISKKISDILGKRQNDFEDAECDDYEIITEGGKKLYSVSRYERKAKNRENAIRIHGTKCMACGFDFEKVYGSIGKNYIEVHHVALLSSKDEEVEVNPATDLIVVCANCHRMIHRKKKKVLTLEELKNIIQSK